VRRLDRAYDGAEAVAEQLRATGRQALAVGADVARAAEVMPGVVAKVRKLAGVLGRA